MSRPFLTVALLAVLLGRVTAPGAALASSTLAQVSGSPRVSTPPPAAGPPSSRAPAIVLNFDNADIETVIEAVSEAVGFDYTIAPDVRGKVTVHTARAVSPEDAFSILLSILEVHGFTAVKAGTLYKIVRTETARQRAIPTFIAPPPGAAGSPAAPAAPTPGSSLHAPPAPSDRGTMPAQDRLLTHVVPGRFRSASALARVVHPLVGARGSLIADPHANVLIVRDTAANVGRILEVVARLDVEPAGDEVRVIPLRFADARYLAGILNQAFAGSGVTGPPVIVADPRTNSLIIRARRSDLEALRRLLGPEE
jgi:general secretion pathway protein D